VSVKGGYFQIEDFLARLENLIKGADPDRVPPRSVLVRSVDISSGSDQGATGGSAAAAPEASASSSELQASVALVVFQLAQAATQAPATGGTPATSTQVR